MKDKNLMEKIVSLAKRRGFIYQGSEIYGGLAGMWDYGPLGVEMKNNVRDLWWGYFVTSWEQVYGLDSAILMNQKVWQASGHIEGFSDPMVECSKCKRRFREDQLNSELCTECAEKLGPVKQFNMMFETRVGASEDSSSISYLRPETAQGIFSNFKNVLDSFHPTIPFGIAQIGKAFRNEIAPKDFLFRAREFEQMEMEWFVREDQWEEEFGKWLEAVRGWIDLIGLDKKKIHEVDVDPSDRAHYSKKTIDFEYEYPFGQSELYGLAYRTDFDLKNHIEHSRVDLQYTDQSTGEKFIPHVIEPSMGLDRTVLALLIDAYHEEKVGEASRVVLKLGRKIAPIEVAVLPLMKKDGLSEKANEIADQLRQSFRTRYDDTGSIGKRYRRQDEIGTPFCVTVDYDTLEDDSVTVRHRDSMKQERVNLGDLIKHLL